MFTKKELDAMLKTQVITLAKYYGIDANMRMLKGDVIEKILKYRQTKVEEPQMSVRVRRIKESQEK